MYEVNTISTVNQIIVMVSAYSATEFKRGCYRVIKFYQAGVMYVEYLREE